MLEQELLREQFQALLDTEHKAEQAYGELAQRITDVAVRDQITQLQRDKQRHIQLIERLLEILE